MNKPIQHSESAEQTYLFQWAKLMENRYPELMYLYHIPNEGKRSSSYGAKLKREGLKSGVPDVCLPVPKDNYHGLYIEMKVGRNKPTENQQGWLDALTALGYYTAVCYGCEEAIELIKKYLKNGGK
jgi:hypothetical protein